MSAFLMKSFILYGIHLEIGVHVGMHADKSKYLSKFFKLLIVNGFGIK